MKRKASPRADELPKKGPTDDPRSGVRVREEGRSPLAISIEMPAVIEQAPVSSRGVPRVDVDEEGAPVSEIPTIERLGSGSPSPALVDSGRGRVTGYCFVAPRGGKPRR